MSFLKAGSYEKNSCNATVSNYCLEIPTPKSPKLSGDSKNSFCFPTPKNLLTSRPQAGKLLRFVGKLLVFSLLSRHIRQSMQIC